MDAEGTQESSGVTSQCTYDVFLSFRGEDTRKNFTDHLYAALLVEGFSTYRDDEEIEMGEDIKSELQKAIQQSTLSLIVFSKDYASSGWCLDELVMTLKHKKTSKHVVLPVFFNVDRSEARDQIGCVGEAFSTHEKRLEAETGEKKNELMGKLNEWKAALREIADEGQRALENKSFGHESEFIEKVVEAVGVHLNPTVPGRAFGKDGSIDVNIMSICGMGGTGKTSTAKLVYNLNYIKFEASSFLANIKECSKHPNGLVKLQRQLLSWILKKKGPKIFNIEEGKTMIKDAIRFKRVLIVLDDVDNVYQLDALVGVRNSFCPGSRIIITTTQKQLLKGYELYMVEEAEKLADEASLMLFFLHAFGQEHPLESYRDYTTRFVEYCGGVHLALVVLGSSLRWKSVDEWKSEIAKLKVIPHYKIIDRLKTSFDSLQDDHDKDLLLHIACFFVGKDKDYAITILEGCGFYAGIGIQNLVDQYLLTVDQDNKLRMHNLLHEMGRAIVSQESPEPERHSIVWHHRDPLRLFFLGGPRTKGLILDFSALKKNNASKRSYSEHLLGRSLQVLGLLKSSSTSDNIIIETDRFSRMVELRLLQLNYVQLTGGYEEFPKRLRWLCWRGFPLRSLPSDFPMENLLVLDVRYSSLKHVWNERKCLPMLKILNLSHSHDLMNTPDLSGLPRLEKLVLKDCINLLEVHESIVELERLRLLNLKGCINLRKLPRKFDQLKYLEKLVLSGCSELEVNLQSWERWKLWKCDVEYE